ncbi:MAG: hypothetical protein KC621_26985 [Myxococcales bacterium]|nr:hypothetical protein [Myxococcales bacterium]
MTVDVTADGPSEVAVGAPATFEIHVANSGETPIVVEAIELDLPDGMEVQSTTPAWSSRADDHLSYALTVPSNSEETIRLDAVFHQPGNTGSGFHQVCVKDDICYSFGMPVQVTEATTTAPSAGASVAPEMAAFLEAFQGDTKAVMGAVEAAAADPNTIFDDRDHLVGVPYLKELKNPVLLKQAERDGRDCYSVRGDEFPDDPDEHTIHQYEICWKDAKIVHLEEVPFGREL